MTGEAPEPPNEHAANGSRVSSDDLQVSARLLLFLADLPRCGSDDVVPASFTQAGMAEAMGTSQGTVARIVGRLVEGGVLSVGTTHVQHRLRRLKVYRLTGVGEALAVRIRQATHGGPPEMVPEANADPGKSQDDLS